MDMQKTTQAGAWIRHPAPVTISGSTSSPVWSYKGSGALFNQLQKKLRILGGCWTGVSEVVFSAVLASLSSGSVFGPSISGALFGSALLF